ncbi:hypothetical protein GWK47_051856 [Chionoecetes opilio]|uniref:Uncharacterized protein n=1 Tax=Chionoecetes opilio TaxID=41210 RepID=A0A8J4Y0J0_CHIOP|nr:hypothetical protein GWK47_051856 [Chionoecetes opilio]
MTSRTSQEGKLRVMCATSSYEPNSLKKFRAREIARAQPAPSIMFRGNVCISGVESFVKGWQGGDSRDNHNIRSGQGEDIYDQFAKARPADCGGPGPTRPRTSRSTRQPLQASCSPWGGFGPGDCGPDARRETGHSICFAASVLGSD